MKDDKKYLTQIEYEQNFWQNKYSEAVDEKWALVDKIDKLIIENKRLKEVIKNIKLS